MPEDVAQHKTVQVKAAVFHPDLARRNAASLGMDPASITSAQKTWNSTSFDHLAKTSGPLLIALLGTSEDVWPHLWIASLIPKHCVFALADSGEYYYAVGVTPYLVYTWRLRETQDCALSLDISSAALAPRTVTSLRNVVVYGYEYELAMSHDCTEIRFHVGKPESLPSFVAQNTAHTLQSKTLKNLCAALGAGRPAQNTNCGFVDLIVTFLGLHDTEGGRRVMRLAREAYDKQAAKRAAAAKRRRREGDESGEGDRDETEGEESAVEEVEEPDTKSMQLLRAIAPMELDYVLGRVSGGCGLNEEEDEAGAVYPPPKQRACQQRARAKSKRQRAPGGSGSHSIGSPSSVAHNSVSSGSMSSDGSSCSSASDSRGSDTDDGLPPQPDGHDIDIDMDKPVPAPATPVLEETQNVVEVPTTTPPDRFHGIEASAAAVFRRRHGQLEAPAGCSFTHNEAECHYRARLPPGVLHEGVNSRQRTYGEKRSPELAYSQVETWLLGAMAEGLVGLS